MVEPRKRVSTTKRNENRFKQKEAIRRTQAVTQRQQKARKQALNNSRTKLDNMGFYRKQTFLDIVTKVTRIDQRVLDEHIEFTGSPGIHTEISLDLGHSIKWACLLFFQYIDMVHDNGSKSSALESWESFCNMVIGSGFYKSEDVQRARTFVREEILLLVKNKASCKGNFDCLTDVHRKQEDIYFFHNILRIMIVHSHFSKKDGIVKLYSKPDERGIIVNVLKFVSLFSTRFQVRKKNVQIRVKGHELLSLDMTNGGRLKDFTASYHKYLHVINFGDKGKYFLPERDIELIIKQIIRRDNSITNKSIYDNTANIRTVDNNNNRINRNSRSVHTVHYNDDPLKVKMGLLKVYVFNQIVKTKPSDNTFSMIKQMLEPIIVYRNDAQKVFEQDTFATAKSDMVDKPDSKTTYSNLMSKHMGDFLNGLNSIHNNVVFASGDSLACVGYLIGVLLIPGAISRMLWEDATNEKIWFVSDKSTNVNHFRKIVSNSTNVKTNTNTNTNTNTFIPVQPMSPKVSDRADSFLNQKLEKEKQIFEGLPNIVNNFNKFNRLPNFASINTQSVYPNFKYDNFKMSNFKMNNMAKAPARFT